MSSIRVSTTVDGDLLDAARRLRLNANDATLLDEALGALAARNRASEIDATYVAYVEFPMDESGEWGDLAAFRAGVAAS
jgi:hypothetical protein